MHDTYLRFIPKKFPIFLLTLIAEEFLIKQLIISDYIVDCSSSVAIKCVCETFTSIAYSRHSAFRFGTAYFVSTIDFRSLSGNQHKWQKTEEHRRHARANGIELVFLCRLRHSFTQQPVMLSSMRPFWQRSHSHIWGTTNLKVATERCCLSTAKQPKKKTQQSVWFWFSVLN